MLAANDARYLAMVPRHADELEPVLIRKVRKVAHRPEHAQCSVAHRTTARTDSSASARDRECPAQLRAMRCPLRD